MKLVMDAGLLTDIVSTVAQAISNKPIVPGADCVYLRAEADAGTSKLTVLAKDSGLGISRTTMDAVVKEDGEALIPAKTLLAFVRLMRGDVELAVDSRFKCTLKSGGKNSSIICLDPENYNPDFAEQQDALQVRMDGNDFESAVASTLHCVSPDQGRLILTGVNFAFDAVQSTCSVTGLDGFRLAIETIPAETNDTFNVTIPADFAKLAAKIIRGREGVSFSFGKGNVIVESADVSMEMVLLSGEYIETERMLIRNGALQVKADAKDLLSAVQLAMISTQRNSKMILLNFSKDGTVLVSANSDRSESEAEVGCEMYGAMENGGDEIAFNGQFIEEALKASLAFSDEVKLMINKSATPMAILPQGRDDYYQLVLPVRRA